LFELVAPKELARIYDRSELWVVDGYRKFRVSSASGQPVALYSAGVEALALSPDGQYVITALPVERIPESWEALYLLLTRRSIPPHAGAQNINAPDGRLYVSQYVSVDLATGSITPLTDAPMGNGAGWCTAPFAPAGATTRGRWSCRIPLSRRRTIGQMQHPADRA